VLKKIVTGAGLLAALAASGALLVAKATPQPAPGAIASVSRLAEGKPFAPICKTGEVVDTRPDPAWVGQSFARDNCAAPQMPAPINGLVASREQIVAGMAATKHYAAASDTYQRCIRDFVAVHQSRPDAGKPVAMALVVIENHRILAAENNKKKAATLMNGAIMAFNEYGSGCPEK
jgi:hypothetical protein